MHNPIIKRSYYLNVWVVTEAKQRHCACLPILGSPTCVWPLRNRDPPARILRSGLYRLIVLIDGKAKEEGQVTAGSGTLRPRRLMWVAYGNTSDWGGHSNCLRLLVAPELGWGWRREGMVYKCYRTGIFLLSRPLDLNRITASVHECLLLAVSKPVNLPAVLSTGS
jgi:hypothetical protein